MSEDCELCADAASHVQDCLKTLAAEGQSIAGFVEDNIFQCFRIDPTSLDAKERWVRVQGCSSLFDTVVSLLRLQPAVFELLFWDRTTLT